MRAHCPTYRNRCRLIVFFKRCSRFKILSVCTIRYARTTANWLEGTLRISFGCHSRIVRLREGMRQMDGNVSTRKVFESFCPKKLFPRIWVRKSLGRGQKEFVHKSTPGLKLRISDCIQQDILELFLLLPKALGVVGSVRVGYFYFLLSLCCYQIFFLFSTAKIRVQKNHPPRRILDKSLGRRQRKGPSLTQTNH